MNQPGRIAWWKAIPLAAGVLFVPFIGMGLYTALFVACSHCKQTVWQLLPVAPGLVPGFLLSRWLAPEAPEWLKWAAVIGSEIFLLAGLTWGVRRGGRWAWIGSLAMLVITTLLAMMTLSLIRA